MPILLLCIGIFITIFALYRFMLKANRKQIVALLMTLGTLILGTALFFLAITGRLPAALGVTAALIPIILSWMQAKTRAGNIPPSSPDAGNADRMTRDNALDILGLKGTPSKKDIIEAHRRLMKKVHPDHQGSEGLAKSLNQAKEFLIKSSE